MAAFTDNFTGTAGAKLTVRSGWTKYGSGFDSFAPEINAANQLRWHTDTSDVALIGQTPGSVDHYVQCKVYTGFSFTGTGTRAGIAVRAVDRADLWYVSHNTSEGVWELFRNASRRVTWSGSLSNGDTVRAEAEGDEIRVYVNGTLRITDSSASDGNTNTRVGIWGRGVAGADPVIDDWESDVLSVGGLQTLTPSLLTNSQTFYAPTVFSGVQLLPSLLTNAQTFYGAAVALPGVTAAYVLANTAATGENVQGAMYEVAGLVDPGDYMTYSTVSGPTPGGGTLVTYIDGSFEYTGGAPAIWVIQIQINGVDYPETTTIYLYDQESTLFPPLLTNAQTFYSPTVANAAAVVAPPLLTNAQTFYAPTVSRVIIPGPAGDPSDKNTPFGMIGFWNR